MKSHADKPKRWRPRFSVRTLVIVVTLVCCYAACWGPTNKWGVADVERSLGVRRTWRPSSVPLPLIVVVDEWGSQEGVLDIYRRPYLWCFGRVIELPYSRKLKDNDLVPSHLRINPVHLSFGQDPKVEGSGPISRWLPRNGP